ncbi:MAG: hypothetical protein V3T70_06995 [Phycisphaerae bacterium]
MFLNNFSLTSLLNTILELGVFALQTVQQTVIAALSNLLSIFVPF